MLQSQFFYVFTVFINAHLTNRKQSVKIIILNQLIAGLLKIMNKKHIVQLHVFNSSFMDSSPSMWPRSCDMFINAIFNPDKLIHVISIVDVTF